MRKTVTGILLVVVAAGVVVAVTLLYPPARPTPPRSNTRPVARPRAPSPAEVVTSYIEALQNRKYETAYALLSKASQQKHSYDDFVSQVEKTGVTDYDLSTARAKEEEGGRRVMVEVQLKEDPSSAGFYLDKEGNAWRIVYLGGIPSFPYP